MSRRRRPTNRDDEEEEEDEDIEYVDEEEDDVDSDAESSIQEFEEGEEGQHAKQPTVTEKTSELATDKSSNEQSTDEIPQNSPGDIANDQTAIDSTEQNRSQNKEKRERRPNPKKDPTFVPRTGQYFLHDAREGAETEKRITQPKSDTLVLKTRERLNIPDTNDKKMKQGGFRKKTFKSDDDDFGDVWKHDKFEELIFDSPKKSNAVEKKDSSESRNTRKPRRDYPNEKKAFEGKSQGVVLNAKDKPSSTSNSKMNNTKDVAIADNEIHSQAEQFSIDQASEEQKSVNVNVDTKVEEKQDKTVEGSNKQSSHGYKNEDGNKKRTSYDARSPRQQRYSKSDTHVTQSTTQTNQSADRPFHGRITRGPPPEPFTKPQSHDHKQSSEKQNNDSNQKQNISNHGDHRVPNGQKYDKHDNKANGKFTSNQRKSSAPDIRSDRRDEKQSTEKRLPKLKASAKEFTPPGLQDTADQPDQHTVNDSTSTIQSTWEQGSTWNQSTTGWNSSDYPMDQTNLGYEGQAVDGAVPDYTNVMGMAAVNPSQYANYGVYDATSGMIYGTGGGVTTVNGLTWYPDPSLAMATVAGGVVPTGMETTYYPMPTYATPETTYVPRRKGKSASNLAAQTTSTHAQYQVVTSNNGTTYFIPPSAPIPPVPVGTAVDTTIIEPTSNPHEVKT